MVRIAGSRLKKNEFGTRLAAAGLIAPHLSIKVLVPFCVTSNSEKVIQVWPVGVTALIDIILFIPPPPHHPTSNTMQKLLLLVGKAPPPRASVVNGCFIWKV